jgi:hypothetical protein
VVWLATVDADQPSPEFAGDLPNLPRSIFEAHPTNACCVS